MRYCLNSFSMWLLIEFSVMEFFYLDSTVFSYTVLLNGDRLKGIQLLHRMWLITRCIKKWNSYGREYMVFVPSKTNSMKYSRCNEWVQIWELKPLMYYHRVYEILCGDHITFTWFSIFKDVNRILTLIQRVEHR